MEYNDIKALFYDVQPILNKAAPILAGYIGSSATGLILGLLGAVIGCSPCEHCELLEKLKNDPDLYAKLQALESTHGKWLENMAKLADD